MLGQGPIWERAQALMRVVCGCQTYEEIRATLKECLTPVGRLFPEPVTINMFIVGIGPMATGECYLYTIVFESIAGPTFQE